MFGTLFLPKNNNITFLGGKKKHLGQCFRPIPWRTQSQRPHLVDPLPHGAPKSKVMASWLEVQDTGCNWLYVGL